jgi:hypothetical protein
MQGKLKPEFPSQGWKQILTERKKMLDAYDRAREQARSHEVETYHGKVAEAEFRSWLKDFLPKRYAVTSGYIVSPGLRSTDKTPHFDVIIYDQLESPILWIEDSPDNSPQGRSLAIPVEFVRAVLEVKAAFSAKIVQQSIEHLKDLSPLLAHVDDPNEPYKLHLSPRFCCGIVFFGLRKADANSKSALAAINGGIGLRGFLGGLILRGEGHSLQVSGRLTMVRSEEPCEGYLYFSDSPLLFHGMSNTVPLAHNIHVGTHLMWQEMDFAKLVEFLWPGWHSQRRDRGGWCSNVIGSRRCDGRLGKLTCSQRTSLLVYLS